MLKAMSVSIRLPTPEVRNRRFDVADVPRHWHGGRRSVTTFFNNLSVFFPAGERFFLHAVRRFEGKVHGDTLQAAVRAFRAQEGHHTREHVRYNRRLIEQGYPVAEMDARVERLLKLVKQNVPPRWQLAATCALEHLTALLAQMLLGDSRLLDGAHPELAELWRWHAAEESEHKAVAYDVYLAAGGNYPERVAVMVVASIIFWAKVLEHQARLMHEDGDLLSPREWLALVTFLFLEPGGMHRLVIPYLQYFRPGFHPTDIDDSHLVDAWRQATAHAATAAA